MRRGENVCLIIAAVVLLFWQFGPGAFGIVVSDDPVKHELVPNDPNYTYSDYYDDLTRVGYLNSTARTAVLINPWYILTCRHCVPGAIAGQTFTLNLPGGDQVFNLVEKFSLWTGGKDMDLAVVRLDRDSGLPGYKLYRGTSEAGHEGLIAGYGISGVGSPDPVTYPAGTKRAGENKVDSVAEIDDNPLDPNNPLIWSLVMDFDQYWQGADRGLGQEREVIFATGDSGGPTFFDVNGVLYQAGIHRATSDSTPGYGDAMYDTRVSSYASWIDYNAPIYADGTRDNTVDLLDFQPISVNYGTTSGAVFDDGDYNYDGAVDLRDFQILSVHFNETRDTGVPALAPEPGTLLLLAASVLAGIYRRKG